MQLTLHADFALRTLIYLGTRPNTVIPASEVATAYGVSVHHMAKVARLLTEEGYVSAARGKGGGIRLAKAPGEIVLGEVVRRTESRFDLVECFDPNTNTCPITNACALARALAEARDAFLRTLDGYTLQDCLKHGDKITELLQIRLPRKSR